MPVTILSGPIGAGKTTVARELLPFLPGPVSYIEGDTFWSFVAKPHSPDGREVFRLMMRSMAAAAVPFARSGYEVLLDFSVPPQFLETARTILKGLPLNYVVLRPSLAVCEARAATRTEGRIADYTRQREFYKLFEDASPYLVTDDESDASTLARRIYEGLRAGKFAVS
jgi:chloramphenicol 3-O-phosphotransferase